MLIFYKKINKKLIERALNRTFRPTEVVARRPRTAPAHALQFAVSNVQYTYTHYYYTIEEYLVSFVDICSAAYSRLVAEGQAARDRLVSL